MPAVVTHHIFGEDAAALLPDGLIEGQEDLLAFLLGSQGTDPFWARVLCAPQTASACHTFATRMHAENMVQTFMCLRDSVSRLHDEDESCGRAFALGMLSHYLLDSMAHPLVFAQQEALVEADPSLTASRDGVHAIIESDLDTWVLWEMRHQTVLDAPCANALASTQRVDRIAGALLSQVAFEVFGLSVGAAEYGLAVRDYRNLYRIIDPPAKTGIRALSKLERLFRPHSRLQAQSHRVFTGDDCPFANLDHRLWRNPATQEASTASFPDLFHDAIVAWPVFSQRFVEGDERRLAAMIDNINYNGRPV